MRLTIAGLQSAGTPGDVEANLSLLRRQARAAAQAGATLLITDEMFLTGYNIGGQLSAFAGQDLIAAVAAIAREESIGLLAGLPEWDGDDCYNAAVLAGSTGEVLGRHRKAHLFGDLDRAMFRAGSQAVSLVDYHGVRIAMLICYDAEFPESVRAAALAGAHLVAVPTAQMTPFSFVAEHLVRVRAWENQVYVAYINHDGSEGDLTYVGRSSIVAPSGEVLAAAVHGDHLLFATIDTEVVASAQRDNPYLADLRGELFG